MDPCLPLMNRQSLTVLTNWCCPISYHLPRYQGRPHWGKNTERTYLHPKCGIKAKYPLLPKLQSIQDKYDPLKVYEPRLFSQLVAGEAYSLQPQCVLSGACFCQKDEHCAPDFRCVASNAFPEYLVCKYKLDLQRDDDR